MRVGHVIHPGDAAWQATTDQLGEHPASSETSAPAEPSAPETTCPNTSAPSCEMPAGTLGELGRGVFYTWDEVEAFQIGTSSVQVEPSAQASLT